MKVRDFLKDYIVYKSKNLIENPKISIILPTYSRGDSGLLKRSIESVIAQTLKEWELIVVDDGSKDSTSTVVEEIINNDNRIIYIKNIINSGLPAIRVNQGIMYSRGRYIAYQFDDDMWESNMLEILYLKILELDNMAMVYGNGRFVNSVNKQERIHGQKYDKETMNIKGNILLNNTVLHSKELPYIYGGYDCHITMRRLCDWDLWRRWAKYIDLVHVDEVVSIVESHHSDSIGINTNRNNIIVEERQKLNVTKELSLYNIADYEIDNVDIISDVKQQEIILKNDILPWKKQRNL